MPQQVNDTVTLQLDGSPTLEDFDVAVTSMRLLLQTLGSQEGQTVPIEWVIDSLESGSALMTVRGVSNDMDVVERVASAYLAAGRSLLQGVTLAPPVSESLTGLISILNGRVPAFRFETIEDDVTISSLDISDEQRSVHRPVRGLDDSVTDYGAVEGRVQTITNRQSLRFTLFDLVYDKAISCYLEPGREDIMADAWGHMAVVEGLVKRDSHTGRATTVRGITQVHVIWDEGRRDDWRRARGALAPYHSEPAEVTIRRIRDAN